METVVRSNRAVACTGGSLTVLQSNASIPLTDIQPSASIPANPPRPGVTHWEMEVILLIREKNGNTEFHFLILKSRRTEMCH